MYQILYTKNAHHDLKILDLETSKRIVKKIYFFSLQKNPLKYAKKLKDFRLGQYRFRIGTYRAIFDVDKNRNIKILMILKIKHRRDIYGVWFTPGGEVLQA